MVSADHSTPCIIKAHSDDPVPILVSGESIKKDQTVRVTEEEAKKGSIGLLEGSQVVKTCLQLIKSQM
jgi:2,3-bisphosphoglycerate-independent phosphoglycerate mutase